MPLSIAEQMIARRKKAQKVIVTCYGESKEFATASKAINFFTYSGGKDAIPLGWHMRTTKVRNK